MNESTVAHDAHTETELDDEVVAPAPEGSVDPEASSEAPSEANGDGQVDMEALLETIEYIRPALQADGGDLVLLGVDAGTVNLQMVGACGGCPMSMMTLKAGIERILFDRVSGVTEVNAI